MAHKAITFHLPDEILDAIVQQVDKYTLPKIRTLCCKTRDMAEKRFAEIYFSNVRVAFTEYGLQSLVSLTAEPRFAQIRKGIKKITLVVYQPIRPHSHTFMGTPEFNFGNIDDLSLKKWNAEVEAVRESGQAYLVEALNHLNRQSVFPALQIIPNYEGYSGVCGVRHLRAKFKAGVVPGNPDLAVDSLLSAILVTSFPIKKLSLCGFSSETDRLKKLGFLYNSGTDWFMNIGVGPRAFDVTCPLVVTAPQPLTAFGTLTDFTFGFGYVGNKTCCRPSLRQVNGSTTIWSRNDLSNLRRVFEHVRTLKRVCLVYHGDGDGGGNPLPDLPLLAEIFQNNHLERLELDGFRTWTCAPLSNFMLSMNRWGSLKAVVLLDLKIDGSYSEMLMQMASNLNLEYVKLHGLACVSHGLFVPHRVMAHTGELVQEESFGKKKVKDRLRELAAEAEYTSNWSDSDD